MGVDMWSSILHLLAIEIWTPWPDNSVTQIARDSDTSLQGWGTEQYIL